MKIPRRIGSGAIHAPLFWSLQRMTTRSHDECRPQRPTSIPRRSAEPGAWPRPESDWRSRESSADRQRHAARWPSGRARGSDRCRAIVLITSSPDEELTARSRSSRELHFLAEAPEHRHLALLPLRVLEAQKRAEQDHELQSLRDARPASEMLRRLADHVPVMLGFWNREQRCGFANHLYERWFGVPRGDHRHVDARATRVGLPAELAAYRGRSARRAARLRAHRPRSGWWAGPSRHRLIHSLCAGASGRGGRLLRSGDGCE